jgi:predicted TIM-barrel fold metal-dependent hydrolase
LTFREFIGESMECIPAFQEPAPRIDLMNEQGIDQAIMYPTLASLIEERTRDDVQLTTVIMHALNEWLLDQWSFEYEGRIYPTPMISLAIVERAIEELEWCVERGARTVLIRPAPVPSIKGGSRSMGLPEFDPFWKRCVEIGLPVTFHASDSGYQRHLAEWEGGDEYLSFKESALREIVVGHRAIEDTIGALVCHGAFTRHPDLKVLVVENGSSFVNPLIEALDRAYSIMPQEFDEHPVEALKRNCYVHPFLEDDVLGTVETLGVEHVLFGSDYPHPEGIGEPLSFIEKLEGLGDADKQLIMGGNLTRVMGTAPPA